MIRQPFKDKYVWVRGNTMKVANFNQHHIRNSKFESERLTKMFNKMLMPVSSKALIVLVHAKSLKIHTPPENVEVLEAHQLRKWLLKQPVILNEKEVAYVQQQLNKPGSWGLTTDMVLMTDEDVATYKILEKEIKSATRVSGVWAAFGIK